MLRLAYRYEGMRLSDTVTMLHHLQMKSGRAATSDHLHRFRERLFFMRLDAAYLVYLACFVIPLCVFFAVLPALVKPFTIALSGIWPVEFPPNVCAL